MFGVFAIICLFGSVETVLSMDCSQWNSIVDLGGQEIRKYNVKGADAFSFIDEGVNGYRNVYDRVKLNIEQITDNNREEEISIQAHKNIFSHIIFNRKGIDVLVEVSAPGDGESLSEKIIIFLALKKYAKIAINGRIDTAFISSIQTDKLSINLKSEATMHMPLIKAREIDIYAKDNSKIKMQDTASLVAKFLSIDRQGKACVDLVINTPLLDVKNNGNGQLRLDGIAKEQRLHLKEGSYLASGLDCNCIYAMIRAARGAIELHAHKLIAGTIALDTQHEITWDADRIEMYAERCLIKKYRDYFNNYSEVDFLREQVYQLLLNIDKTVAFKIFDLLFLN